MARQQLLLSCSRPGTVYMEALQTDPAMDSSVIIILQEAVKRIVLVLILPLPHTAGSVNRESRLMSINPGAKSIPSQLAASEQVPSGDHKIRREVSMSINVNNSEPGGGITR